MQSAVVSGDVSSSVATTSIIARKAVFSRGSRRAGEIWLIDSSPENASQAPAKPTIARQGPSDPTPRNWFSTRCQVWASICHATITSRTRLTASDAAASTAVSTADSRMPITLRTPSKTSARQAAGVTSSPSGRTPPM